jgi:DnaK suppressor protein
MVQKFDEYRTILESRIAELQRGIQQLDYIAVEQNPDQTDESQSSSDRELAISNIDRNSKELRNARAALRRIREGSFGVCQECEEEIHPKRLAAIPWASLCIHCQEALDRHREELHIHSINSVAYATRGHIPHF